MAIRKTTKLRARRKPNEHRRKSGGTVYEEVWDQFVQNVREGLAEAIRVSGELGSAPYYSPPNVVKRTVYEFVAEARRSLKPGPLEDTIDAIRVASAGQKVLRTLRKDIRKEPYYWVLTGLYLDCPEANLRKPDVTRFAQHLNYAHRHEVPAEYLIGFLLQTGSNSEVYKRALDPNRREQWHLSRSNSK